MSVASNAPSQTACFDHVPIAQSHWITINTFDFDIGSASPLYRVIQSENNRTTQRNGKTYYCPLKDNSQVDDSGGSKPYQRVDALTWSETEKQHGKTIKIKSFLAQHKVKVFRVVLSTQRTYYICADSVERLSNFTVEQAVDWHRKKSVSQSENYQKPHWLRHFSLSSSQTSGS